MKKVYVFPGASVLVGGVFLGLPRTSLLGEGNEQVGNVWVLFLIVSVLYGALLPLLSGGDRFFEGVLLTVFVSFAFTAGLMYPAFTLTGSAVCTGCVAAAYSAVRGLCGLRKRGDG